MIAYKVSKNTLKTSISCCTHEVVPKSRPYFVSKAPGDSFPGLKFCNEITRARETSRVERSTHDVFDHRLDRWALSGILCHWLRNRSESQGPQRVVVSRYRDRRHRCSGADRFGATRAEIAHGTEFRRTRGSGVPQ